MAPGSGDYPFETEYLFKPKTQPSPELRQFCSRCWSARLHDAVAVPPIMRIFMSPSASPIRPSVANPKIDASSSIGFSRSQATFRGCPAGRGRRASIYASIERRRAGWAAKGVVRRWRGLRHNGARPGRRGLHHVREGWMGHLGGLKRVIARRKYSWGARRSERLARTSQVTQDGPIRRGNAVASEKSLVCACGRGGA